MQPVAALNQESQYSLAEELHTAGDLIKSYETGEVGGGISQEARDAMGEQSLVRNFAPGLDDMALEEFRLRLPPGAADRLPWALRSQATRIQGSQPMRDPTRRRRDVGDQPVPLRTRVLPLDGGNLPATVGAGTPGTGTGCHRLVRASTLPAGYSPPPPARPAPATASSPLATASARPLADVKALVGQMTAENKAALLAFLQHGSQGRGET